MADSTITNLTSVGTSQDTDVFPMDQGGVTYKVSKSTLLAAITTAYQAADALLTPLSYLDTDGTLAANSNSKIATQRATKTYVDTAVTNMVTTTGTQTLTNKTINASSNTISNITLAMLATNVADTDGTLAANSDTRVATQRATKTYVDAQTTAAASETTAGKAELATQGETNAGTDDLRIVTPLKLATRQGVKHTTQSTERTFADFDSNQNLTCGTDAPNQYINATSVQTTTANRVWTIIPSAAIHINNNFNLFIPAGRIGTGFTWKVQLSGTDILVLTEGSMVPTMYQFIYNGSSYRVLKNSQWLMNGTNQNDNCTIRTLGGSWDFDVQGGAIGTITIPSQFPKGAVLLTDQAYIHCTEAVAGGAGATISWGITGTNDLFDSPRAYNSYLYAGSNRVKKGQKYGVVTGNTPTSNTQYTKITTATLTNAAAATTTVTLTNGMIATGSRVQVTVGNYSGTIGADGWPFVVESNASAGQVVITIVNIHTANALNGTLELFVTVEDPFQTENVNNVTAATAITMTIAGNTLTDGKATVYVPYMIQDV